MLKRSHIYWYCQIFGWSFYIIVNSIFLGLSTESNYREYLIYGIMLFAGIAISHVYRSVVLRLNVLNYRIPAQLIFIIVFSFLKGVAFFLVILSLTKAFGLDMAGLTVVSISEYVLNFTVVFCLWNVIYFGFQYFQNYRRAEINSLRYLAASKESELNNLKAQLNPHFIFNCMNSIRALIDEHPQNAKTAVTRLSNILRNTLQLDKNKEVPLNEEMNLVKDYLELEKIRYEHRLSYAFEIQKEAESTGIPPFIIQTQVENAIKHGISRLPGNGLVKVEAYIKDETLLITVSNTGIINSQKPDTGVGFRNSNQRLSLLYGKSAGISLRQKGDFVVVEINIPLKKSGHRSPKVPNTSNYESDTSR